MKMRRIRRAVALLAALVVPVGLTTAAPAHASGDLATVSCPVGGTTSSTSPGLLLFESREVTTTVTAQYSCTVIGGGPLISFRTGTSSVSLPPAVTSCLTPLEAPPASQQINWSTEGSSTLTGTTTMTDTGTAIVITDRGTVAAGEFKDSPYVNVVEYTNLSPQN